MNTPIPTIPLPALMAWFSARAAHERNEGEIASASHTKRLAAAIERAVKKGQVKPAAPAEKPASRRLRTFHPADWQTPADN